MRQDVAGRQVQRDGAVPYGRLWSACFFGFTAIGMTIQVPGGATWTMGQVDAVPEPSGVWFLIASVFGMVVGAFFRRLHRPETEE